MVGDRPTALLGCGQFDCRLDVEKLQTMTGPVLRFLFYVLLVARNNYIKISHSRTLNQNSSVGIVTSRLQDGYVRKIGSVFCS